MVFRTAKACGIEPQRWLVALLKKLSLAQSADDEALLPRKINVGCA